jgi:hypothetical protein
VQDAITACRASMAASPTGAPDPDLTDAVVAALGPFGRVLESEETAVIVALRPALRGPLVAPVDAGFIAPVVLRRRRLDRLIELDAPEVILAQEREILVELEAGSPFSPDAALASPHPDHARFPGNARRLHLALACASRIAPWLGAHPVLALLTDAHRILAEQRIGLASLAELRAEIERTTNAEDAPILPRIIVRAIVLAHDLATETDARVEQNEPHDLVRWATEQHDPARDLADLNREFFTWWLDQAVPAALEV